MITTHLILLRFFPGAGDGIAPTITTKIIGRLGIGGANRVNVIVPVVKV